MSTFAVTINGTYLGQKIANTLGVRGPGDVPAGSQAQDICNRVRDLWTGALLSNLSSAYVVTEVTAYSITNPEITAFAGGSNAGGGAGDPISGALCVAVDILTGLRGRSFRGRTGLAGLLESAVSGNTIVEASRASYQTAITQFRLDMLAAASPTTEPYEIGVVSRFNKKIKRPVPIFTPSTSMQVRSRVGTRITRLR